MAIQGFQVIQQGRGTERAGVVNEHGQRQRRVGRQGQLRHFLTQPPAIRAAIHIRMQVAELVELRQVTEVALQGALAELEFGLEQLFV
ncbi:hypothetical protein D9M68_955140 [compost metagenome]